MQSFGLPDSPLYDIRTYTGNTVFAATAWQQWTKPKGKSMCSIFVLGSGGGGGNGVIGANSTAGGGAGGGTGGQTFVTLPLNMLPDSLYISVPFGVVGAGNISYVAISPTNVVGNTVVVLANGGGVGGNASGATAGVAGTAGTVVTAASMCIGAVCPFIALAGQAGQAGGTTAAPGNLTIPTTGLRVVGGTGGGGLPAAAATGSSGGNYTLPSPSPYPAHNGGVGSATATSPADNGVNGYNVWANLNYFYGGTGGASTHGTATGGGLVQSSGGSAIFGSGGGGSGGALTGSTAGTPGRGGSGLVIITCW